MIIDQNRKVSSYVHYPRQYKFTSIDIEVNYDMLKTYRETYDLFELFGDLGGLYEAFRITLGSFMALYFTISAELPMEMAATIFKVNPRSPPKEQKFNKNDSDDEKEPSMSSSVKRQTDADYHDLINAGPRKTLEAVKKRLMSLKPFVKFPSWAYILCSHKKEIRILEKTESIIEKELDLRHFLRNQRFMMTAIQGLLSGRQQTFIDQISTHVVDESTEFD